MARDVLLLGASGYYGSHLLGALGNERALGTYCKTPFKDGVPFDALADDVGELLRDEGPFEYGVMLFAEPHIDECARHPEYSRALNVNASVRIAEVLQSKGVVPVFVSTDVVFDGTKGNYVEEDPTNPILTYGRQKRDVEAYLEGSGGDFLVIRVSKYLGRTPGDGSMLAAWLKAIERGEKVLCATDQYLTLIEIDDAVAALIRLMDLRKRGLFHVAGPRRWRRDVLFRELVEAVSHFHGISPVMEACSVRDIEFHVEPRPLDTTLNCDKLISETGFRACDIAETCMAIAERAYSK